MRLNVLNVAYPLAPVGPDAIGGAEQVLARLDAALVRAGHESIVLACEGSVTQGELIAGVPCAGPFDEAARKQARQKHREAIQRVLESRRIDLIHMHGIDFMAYLPSPGIPAVITLHLPPDWYGPEVFQVVRPHTHLHCVSATQRRDRPRNRTGDCRGRDRAGFSPWTGALQVFLGRARSVYVSNALQAIERNV